MKYITYYKNGSFLIKLESDGVYLTRLSFVDTIPDFIDYSNQVFSLVKSWLEDYFNGINRKIDFSIKLDGSSFSKSVWDILLKIDYGKSTTYKEIANIIKDKRNLKYMSSQAVGQAIKKNPIAIIVPCHRVLGSGNKLTGYAYGLNIKKRLLNIEKIEYKEN